MLDRRRYSLLVTLASVAILATAAGCYNVVDDDKEDDWEALNTTKFFPQSVASGDPRPDSMVFWTRLVDADETGDLDLTLTVATDEALTEVVAKRDLTALAADDHCVKVKIDGLSAGTTYWYRFRYENDDGWVTTRLGRTRTAPLDTDDVTVRWAFFSCQDFVGRWYNAYIHLLETYPESGADLDFVVFLGDYVYENTGDPSFQTPSADRAITFTDTAGAIERTSDAGTFYSAKSLANYRTLYKTHRSDPWLQRIHEMYPMIAVWDDHEFSDDHHGATATYFDGKSDEEDAERRKNSERAFFEYLPIEVGLGADGTLAITDADLYPNTRIYDRFRFGANCEIFLTDSRTYRPDHLIPEDAFPGQIILDETTAEAILGVGNGVEPYVDMDAAENADLKAAYILIVTAAYLAENPTLGAVQANVNATEKGSGLQSARYVNGAFAAAQQPEPFDQTALDAMPKGLAYVSLGKTTIYSSLGSRYAVNQDLLAAYETHLRGLGGTPDDVLGATQTAWLTDGVAASEAVWKVVGNSVSFTPMVLDFTSPLVAGSLPDELPDEFRVRLQLNADQWDGFPLTREELLNTLSRTEGVVMMSGDIHSSWLADHGDRSAFDAAAVHRIFEFTGVAVSSGTFGQFIDSQITEIPGLGDLDLSAVLPVLGPLFQLSSQVVDVSRPSEVLYTDLDSNGYVVMEAASDALRGLYHHYPTDEVKTSYYDDIPTLMGLFETTEYEVRGGSITEIP